MAKDDALQSRVADLAVRSRARSAQQLARDRADFGDDIATLAAFRDVFGPDCRLLWAHNGQRAIGKPQPRGVVCAVGDGKTVKVKRA